MLRLLLLRHAKSSWKHPELADHLRPLNRRGRAAAPQMAHWLRSQSLIPSRILCSTATRARETCRLITAEWSQQLPVTCHDSLYLCEAATFLAELSAIEGNTGVAIIAHNPTIEQFLSRYCGIITDIPTAAIVEIQCHATDWSHLALVDLPEMRVRQIWRPAKDVCP